MLVSLDERVILFHKYNSTKKLKFKKVYANKLRDLHHKQTGLTFTQQTARAKHNTELSVLEFIVEDVLPDEKVLSSMITRCYH